MHIPINGPGELTTARLLKLLCLLWLAGIAMRLAILAVVPLIPLIEAEMHLSETEIGLLVSLPMLLFAIAAIPGALLVARFGAWLTLVGGMSVAAIGAGARGAAVDIWTLYAATIVLGVGNSVMQPALPSLVRAWLPKRTSLGMTIITSGMVIGVALAPVLTIPFVLPLTYQSWRPALVFWAIPLLGTLLLFVAFSPAPRVPKEWGQQSLAHWWPDWKNKQIWRLGMTYGTNIGIFFGTNAFIPDYLTSIGRPDLIGYALGWLNGSQLIAPLALLLVPEGFQLQRWPYLVFGPATLATLIGLVAFGPDGVVICAALLGVANTVTFAAALALPALLSAPADVHRVAAGTYTISFTVGVIVPIISGAIWDISGQPWLTFIPISLCAIGLTVFGVQAIAHHHPVARK